MWKCRLHTFPNNLQTVIFISDFACLQAINLTNSTTGDLVFMGGKEFYPIYAESSWWNTLMTKNYVASSPLVSIWFYPVRSKISSFYGQFILFSSNFLWDLFWLYVMLYYCWLYLWGGSEEASNFMGCFSVKWYSKYTFFYLDVPDKL